MTIAVVDDEVNVRLTLKTALEKEQFTVKTYDDGNSAFSDITANNFLADLYILDIMMPIMDGLTFLRKFRNLNTDVPVMFLTSRDEEFDKVLGLELGADDYLCKPFSLRELTARIHVLLRRSSANKNNILKADKQILKNNEIVLDLSSYTASISNQPLLLTVTEFRILEVFLKNEMDVLSREQLIEAAYPDDTYLNDRAIDCHIKRLRKKIGSEKIETVYGLGYRFKS